MRKTIAPRHAALALALAAAGVTSTLFAAPPGRGQDERLGERESGDDARGPGRGMRGSGEEPRGFGDDERGRPPRHHGPPPPLHLVLEHHAEELGLDDATLDRIREIADGVREEMEARHDAVRTAHDSLRSLAETPAATPAQIEAAARQLGDAEAAMAVLHVTTAQGMLALLTPEQREILAELMPPPPRGDERRGGGPPEPR